jgi:hypothetical protein
VRRGGGDPCRVTGIQGANQPEDLVMPDVDVEEAPAVETRIDRVAVVRVDLIDERLEVVGGSGDPPA